MPSSSLLLLRSLFLSSSSPVYKKHFPGQVIDTPDLTNLELGEQGKKQQVARWKEMAFPGPSAIILAVHGEIKFTQQERDVYEEVKKLWGDDNDFCCRLIIVFTFADRLEKSIVGALGGVSPELKGILAQAGNMCVEVSNTGSPEKKRQAVKKILDSVKTLG